MPPPDNDREKSEAEYNHLFDALVGEPRVEQELIGYIAYIFYKIAKREWVQSFYDRHGRHPGDLEMRAYISTWTPTVIDSVRSDANRVLTAYASYVVDRSTPRIREDALKDRSFVRDALVAFCGAFFYSLVLILAAVVLHFLGIDVVEVSKNLSPK